MSDTSLVLEIAGRLRNGGAALAIELREEVTTWADVQRTAERLDEGLKRQGLGPGAVIGVLGRNRSRPAAAFLGVLASARCAALINPFQPVDRIVADARAAGATTLLIEEEDAENPAWNDAGSLWVLLADGTVRSHRQSNVSPPPGRPRVALLAATSGTTGEPKRIPLGHDTLHRALQEIAGFNRGFGDLDLPGPEQPALIQYSPLAHIAGALTLARAGLEGRSVVLLEKFEAATWGDVVRRRKPRTTGLPPAMMKMVLEADLPATDLASLRSVWSGSAPVDPNVEQVFTARYGLPVLGNYGATEFCGAVANWSLDDYRRFHSAKAGSVGRVSPAVAATRVRSIETGEILGAGEIGVLDLQVHRVGTAWLPTTDLASIDADGFLFLHGRADDAINRGGFKVLPDVVVAALRRHPGVTAAAVVGLADPRLGEVPVAVVEIGAEGVSLTEADLIAFVKSQLPAYQAPVAVRIVQALPRTPAMKVDRPAMRALFTAVETCAGHGGP